MPLHEVPQDPGSPDVRRVLVAERVPVPVNPGAAHYLSPVRTFRPYLGDHSHITSAKLQLLGRPLQIACNFTQPFLVCFWLTPFSAEMSLTLKNCVLIHFGGFAMSCVERVDS